jgi:hypothetical protein
VLQNISIALTVYEQGATNANGKSVADKVVSFSTRDLIAAIGAVTDQDFGNNAKLVQSTIYSNVTVVTGPGVYSNYFSTNLAITTNNLNLSIGASIVDLGTNVGTISTNQLTDSVGEVTISTNVIAILGNTNKNVTIDTNAGFVTTLTPETNNSGTFTNLAVVTQRQISPPPTASVLTNVSSSLDILYGGSANALFPVTNYISLNAISPEIVVEAGSGLDTTNALTVSNLASQTGYSIQGLQINYSGASNMTLSLQGFVKQGLKVDVMSARDPKAVEDIFGASSTWNVNGFGYAGGEFTTNPTPVSIMGGYLTNASSIVVQGSVNVGFLGNLAQ